MANREMSLAVVGADHPNRDGGNRRFEILVCAPGDPVTLRPEPKNPFDSNAIAVISERGVQLGYLTAERAPLIGSILRRGGDLHAIFQRVTASGALIRLGLDGNFPTLPGNVEIESRGMEDDGFWPDPIWPESFRDN